MRSTPVALAVLLACLPGRAMELIDLDAAHSPVQPPSQVFTHQQAQFPPYFQSYFPLYSPYSFPQSFSSSSAADIPPHPAAQLPRHPSLDDGAGMALHAALSELPSSAGTPPPVDMGAAPLPVPEPVSVLMLACGLLVMVPGAWAARWSRLGDSESLLQRRLP